MREREPAGRVADDVDPPRPAVDEGDPDPYPNLEWMRSTMPVTEIVTPAGRAWFVTSFDYTRMLFTDSRVSNDPINSAEGRYGKALPGELLANGPPTHPRLRKVIAPFFTPARVNAMWRDIAAICEAAVDRFIDAGETELVDAYALPVPVAVIHDVLGVPEHVRDDPRRVLDLFVRFGFHEDDTATAQAEVERYARRLVEYKAANPGDDVITALIAARDSGELLSEDELLGILYFILGAGHTTTVPFLSSTVLRLLQNPERISGIVTDPEYRTAVVEEGLRYDSAVQMSVNRYATADIDIGGVTIRKGDRIVLSIAGANRDPNRFADAERFAPRPGNPSHIAFGHGAHICAGVNLARLEGDVALEVLFRRLPTLRLAVPDDDIVWTYGPSLRGPRAVPVAFDKA